MDKKYWLALIDENGEPDSGFHEVTLMDLPRIGEEVVTGKSYDGNVRWQVIMIQHLDNVGSKIIVRPLSYVDEFGYRTHEPLV